jgi:hypothetical protein
MHTFPWVCSKATNPSSHTAMAPSLLSSSLSRARCCPYSSMANACEGDGALRQSASRDQRHDKEASPCNHQHRVKTHHLADGDTRHEEASDLAQRDGGWRQSWRGIPPQGPLPWSPPLVITDNGAGRASRSETKKSDFCPNSLKIKRAR